MSQWDDFLMDDKILQILDVQSHDPSHHFGKPFMTRYQIAIEFQRQFPDEFTAIGKPVGGRGIGQPNSLSQYIANELSKRIIDRRITNIEGRFLYRQHLHNLQYDNNGDLIESSSMESYDLSLFRLVR